MERPADSMDSRFGGQWQMSGEVCNYLQQYPSRCSSRYSARAQNQSLARQESLARELLNTKARGCEGIWGSAQRPRWKFWARLERPKDGARANQLWRFPLVLTEMFLSWLIYQSLVNPVQ